MSDEPKWEWRLGLIVGFGDAMFQVEEGWRDKPIARFRCLSMVSARAVEKSGPAGPPVVVGYDIQSNPYTPHLVRMAEFEGEIDTQTISFTFPPKKQFIQAAEETWKKIMAEESPIQIATPEQAASEINARKGSGLIM